MIEIDPN